MPFFWNSYLDFIPSLNITASLRNVIHPCFVNCAALFIAGPTG